MLNTFIDYTLPDSLVAFKRCGLNFAQSPAAVPPGAGIIGGIKILRIYSGKPFNFEMFKFRTLDCT